MCKFLPVGDNWMFVGCGPPEERVGLGGSIFQGALGNGPKSLFKFDPINIIWSLPKSKLCVFLCLSVSVGMDF